jgi:hypothetical protein
MRENMETTLNIKLHNTKGGREIYCGFTVQKEGEVVILTSERTDFKAMKIIRDKEGC